MTVSSVNPFPSKLINISFWGARCHFVFYRLRSNNPLLTKTSGTLLQVTRKQAATRQVQLHSTQSKGSCKAKTAKIQRCSVVTLENHEFHLTLKQTKPTHPSETPKHVPCPSTQASKAARPPTPLKPPIKTPYLHQNQLWTHRSAPCAIRPSPQPSWVARGARRRAPGLFHWAAPWRRIFVRISAARKAAVVWLVEKKNPSTQYHSHKKWIELVLI